MTGTALLPGVSSHAAVESFRRAAARPVRAAQGLDVLCVDSRAFPLLHLRLVARAGARFDPAGREGLAALLVSALVAAEEGSAGRLRRVLESRGADFASGVDADLAFLGIDTLADDLDRALELLGAWCHEWQPPCRSSFERLRERQARGAFERQRRVAQRADEMLQRIVFRDTVYGRPWTGDESSLSRIDLDDLALFHAGNYCRSGLTLIAVGRFAAEELVDRAARCFPSAPRPAPALPPIDLHPLPETRLYWVDEPDLDYVEIRVGQAGPALSHPGLPRLELLNAILGATSGSRLQRSLRTEKGWAYGVHSRLVPLASAGIFKVSAAVSCRQAGAAIGEILAILDGLQQTPPTQEEIAAARLYLAGALLQSFVSGESLLQQLQRLPLSDLTAAPALLRSLERAEEVDGELLLRLARETLTPGRLAIVAVGPQAELLKSAFLQGFPALLADPRRPGGLSLSNDISELAGGCRVSNDHSTMEGGDKP